MDLYLKTFIVCLRKSYAGFPLFKHHPFYWAAYDGPAMNASWRARLKWYFDALLLVSYYAYLVVRTARTTFSPVSSLASKFYMIFTAVIYSFGVLFDIFAIIYDVEFVTFMKGYLEMLKNGKVLA